MLCLVAFEGVSTRRLRYIYAPRAAGRALANPLFKDLTQNQAAEVLDPLRLSLQ